jgi:hypothetical protein
MVKLYYNSCLRLDSWTVSIAVVSDGSNPLKPEIYVNSV